LDNIYVIVYRGFAPAPVSQQVNRVMAYIVDMAKGRGSGLSGRYGGGREIGREVFVIFYAQIRYLPLLIPKYQTLPGGT